MEGRNDPKYKAFESDSGSDSDTSSLGSDESLANVAGPDFAEFARQLKYDSSKYRKSNNEFYYPYTSTLVADPVDTIVSTEGPLPANLLKPYERDKPKFKEVTTLFLIDSKNRDKLAYPQPTAFTLKPPRIYKNIVSIQVSQLKLLSSFFYFRIAKGNVVLPIIERGRETINKYLGFPLTEAVTIPEGTYVINDLLNKLQIEMNYTPLFYDYPNGISDFITVFTTNGDLSINFNQPGDTYYDSLNSKYFINPTIDQIILHYWGSRYAGLTQYSLDQIKVAYYYPVIYELFLDTTNPLYKSFNTTVPSNLLEPGEDVRTHILFNSSGLNDKVILYIVNNNIPVLDSYRLENTFRFYLVNKYQLAYDTNTLRVNILAQTLNTSLVNLFNVTNATNLSAALSDLGISSNAYSNQNATLNRAKVVFTDMYNYIQNSLREYFAIGYATYASQYFTVTSNILYIQNGTDAVGIRSGYTSDYLTSGEVPIVSSINVYSNSPGFWPNFNTSNNYGGAVITSNMNPSESMVPYSIPASNFNFGSVVIDGNYYIQTSKSSRSVDCVVTINPAKYTIFKFKSPCRQTLQVETLPLPYYYRFGDYNKAGLYTGVLDASNNNVPMKYFDLSYAFVYNTSGAYKNSLMDNSNYSTLNLAPTFGTDYQTAYTSSPVYNLNVQSNTLQYEFTAPYPPLITSGLLAYATSLSFVCMSNTTISTLWADPVQAYLYHDRAAFMADLQFTRNENSNHYIASNVGSISTSDITFNVSTFAGHKYYTIFRSQNTGFPNMLFKPIIYYPISSFVQVQTDYVNFNPLANPNDQSNLTNYPFVTNYNTDFLRLPTNSTLQGIDPANSKFTQNVVIEGKPIGYDISGVSNDLTDYRGYISKQPGFVPNTTFRVDPISKYSFQSLSPFNSNTNSYFDNNSSNALLQPITNTPYIFKGISSSQIKIVHWYDGYSIPRQAGDAFFTSNTISSPITSSLSDYVQGFPSGSNGLQFGQGINAIGFLPTDGLYEISSFTFKSVLYPIRNISTTSEDPNTQIKYIGVFQGSYLPNNIVSISSALTVLQFSKSRVYGPSTLNQTPNFGVELGTWYEYGYDPSFVVSSNVKISGYTQASNELLSYNSMYYLLPFNAAGSNITYSRLSGTLLPYPLSQVVSSGSTYFGQRTVVLPGVTPQTNYLMPSTIANANPAYGPQGTVAYTQSQYEQSQPITTNSLGFRDFGFLVNNSNALFNFDTVFSTSVNTISRNSIGLTTHFSEYNDTLFLINSLTNNSTISNAPLGFSGAYYASSISTTISLHGGTSNCIHYLISSPSTLQNYTYTSLSNNFSSFIFEPLAYLDTNIITRSFDIDIYASTTTIWLWGGGGATWNDATNISSYGGAGAYVKAEINIQGIYNTYNKSTIYLVIGKGGNRDNFLITSNSGLQGYEQTRYGGGGTSLLANPISLTDGIGLQGGGFTGIFLTSTLSNPLLIVGGGGAGGGVTLGGPGGFGTLTQQIPNVKYYFSTVVLNTKYTTATPSVAVQDIDSNSATNPVGNIIDSNLNTFWNPVSPPFMNLNNYSPTPNTYRVTLQYGSNNLTLNTLRFYGSPTGSTANLPTGFVVYNNSNKSQLLYSNTNIQYSNILTQVTYDMSPIAQFSTNTLTTNAWIVGGAADYPKNMIQYSIDGSNWATVTTLGPSLKYDTAQSILYVSSLSTWFAAGTDSNYIGFNDPTIIASNWSLTSNPTPNINGAVAISQSGQYQVIAGSAFYISNNYGSTWTLTSITSGANVTAISGNGQYILVAVNNIINISSNTGLTFTPITSLGSLSWVGLAISASGQYMVACFGAGNIVLSSNYGQAWTSVANTSGGNTCACISSDGQYILIGRYGSPIILSSNYGQTFTNVTGFPGTYNGNYLIFNVSVSSTGQYMMTSQYLGIGVNMSSNYGVTWTSVNLTGTTQTPFFSGSVSGSGQYMSVGSIAGGPIWFSKNYGVSWSQLAFSVNGSWSSLAMSSGGDYQIAMCDTRTAGLAVGAYISNNIAYPSINYGATVGSSWSLVSGSWLSTTSFTWRTITGLPVPITTGIFVAISASGQYQLSANYLGGLYISNNYGSTWTLTSITTGVKAIAISGNAQYILVSINNIINISSNSGSTFTPTTLGTFNWAALAISASGQYMVACISGGNVVVSSTFGQTWTSVTAASGNTCACISSDGQYILFGRYGSPIILSSNYGQTFTNVTGFPGTYNGSYLIFNVSVSSTGQYMMTSQYLGFGVNISSNYGVTWTSVNFVGATTTQFYSGSMSGSGQYMTVGILRGAPIWFSSNYGVTWSQVAFSVGGSWYSIAISNNGLFQIAGNTGEQGTLPAAVYGATTTASYTAISGAGKYQLISIGGLYVSNSYGSTWAPTSITANSGICAISAMGQYIVVSASNILNVSSNYGSTWTPIPSAGSFNWAGLAMSGSGRYSIAFNTLNGLLSSNYGITWTTVVSVPSTTSWLSAAISLSGQYMLGTTNNSSVYLSSNYGSTWAPITSLGSITSYASAISTSGKYMIIATTTGQVYISSNNGVTWIQPTIASNPWYSATISSTGRYMTVGVKTTVSANIWTSYDFGVTWTEITSPGSWVSIAMSGNGKYGLAVTNNDTTIGVYRSLATDPSVTTAPILKSSDGLNWTPCLVPEYNGSAMNGLTFGNGILIAAGNAGTSGCFMISFDGYTWSYGGISGSFNTNASKVRFLNNAYWAVGGNDAGLKTSIDGVSWTNVATIANNPSDITFGIGRYVLAQTSKAAPYTSALIYSSDGITWQAVTATSNLATFLGYSIAFGNAIFVAGGTTTDGSSSIKYSITGIFWFNTTFSFSSNHQSLEIKFLNGKFISVGFSKTGIGKAANQLSIVTSTDGITWTPTLSGGYNSDINQTAKALGADYGPVTIIPNLSSVYLEIQATSQPLIYEIQSINIPLPIDPQDSDHTISSMIDNNLTTSFWPSEAQTVGITDYSFLFRMSSLVSSFNTLKVYIPYVLSPAYFTGITIQTSPTNTVFSNPTIPSRQFIRVGGNYVYTAVLPTTQYNISSLNIQINKLTPNSIIISEVVPLYDPNVGLIQDSPNGYAGGFINTMARTYISPEDYNGGGGFINLDGVQPGIGGIGGLDGSYLTGGSPGPGGNQATASTFSQITYGTGGGGGGYYGGGGAGINPATSAGGAGGGGAGFFNTELISLLDYGTAVPGSNNVITNYLAPGLSELNSILAQYNVPVDTLTYGQGGTPGVDIGRGEHGFMFITYTGIILTTPSNAQTAMPYYIDGSKLSLFQVPITYSTDDRRLRFTTYLDSIEQSIYSGYNWVWYRSYLSLTGCTLLSSMTPSSNAPSQPILEFPHLPSLVYTVLADQFSNVSSFYGGDKSSSNISTITESISLGLDLFKSYFINTSYTAPEYVEMTEIYGLFDYLRVRNNLEHPHINTSNTSLDRVFGGVPRFGYWANPFLTNASYVGYDVGPSQFAPSPLARLTGTSNPVTAMYGLVMEQCLSTGIYELKDIMAYKPTHADATTYGSNWLIATQFPESYVIRRLSNAYYSSNIKVQPYTFKNCIEGRLPLFNYKVYTTPQIINSSTINVPIHMINDFEGVNTFFYTFQNIQLDNISSISLTSKSFISTMIQINQTKITSLSNIPANIIGTAVSEYTASTNTQVVTKFGFSTINTFNFTPIVTFSNGANNFYNDFTLNSQLSSQNVGKALTDYNGNLYESDNKGTSKLYENICSIQIYMEPFKTEKLKFESPRNILSNYLQGDTNPFYDFFTSKYTNIWHLQGTSNLSTIFGVRLTSPYDFNVTTQFVNQIFYPTHKIVLTKKGSSINPIIDAFDLSNYPSYPRTEMFFYNNFSTLVQDISGQFALENTSNFVYNDITSGYFFNSYIHNINLSKSYSSPFGDGGPDSYNYLAIRAYSPSETFNALVRFYLPGRYDFGYITLTDLSNEIITVQTDSNVNPEYKKIIGLYNSSFAISQIFGATGLPGFSGSNITSVGFGDFLKQYVCTFNTINTTSVTVSTVNGRVAQGTSNLITGDLKYILPSYIATRERVTDPLEFLLPFSTVVSDSNRYIDEYGIGYNLGFNKVDTPFNTIQRADSFFKILDDYIYMMLNPEFNMNRLDISRQEDFSVTKDPVAESQMYNCKLLLNTFGSYSTTFVQNPVYFNPVIGKLDKLSFSWYDTTGTLIDNSECEWSGTIQIVEKLDIEG